MTLRRLLLALVSLVVLASLGLTPASAQVDPATGYGIALRSQDPYVAQAGGLFTIAFDMVAPVDGSVTFTVFEAVTNHNDSRRLLDEWMAGKPATGALDYNSFPAALFAPNLDGTFTAQLPIAQGPPKPDAGFTLTDPGVYPLTVSLNGADGARLGSFTTFMVVLGAQTVGTPFQLAPVVRVHAPLGRQPDGTYRLAEADGRRLAAVRTLLAEHPSSALTIDPTPETLDTLAALPKDPAAPTAAQLATAVHGRNVLGSPYVDLDVGAWLAADLTGELARQRTLGTDAIRGQWGTQVPVDDHTWLARSALDGATLDGLPALGLDRLVVPSDAVAGVDAKEFDGRRNLPVQFAEQQPFDIENPAGGRFRSTVADARLASRLTATGNTALNAQYAIADLAVLYCGPTAATQCKDLPKPARGVALDVPDDPAALSSFDALLDSLQAGASGGTTMVQPVSVDQLLSIDPATVSGAPNPVVRGYQPEPTEPGPSLVTYRDRLRRLEPQVAGYHSMVDTTVPERAARLSGLLDVSGAVMPDDVRPRYLDTVDDEMTKVMSAIHAPPQEPATLTATDAPLQLRVDNGLDYPVMVRLVLTSEKVGFDDGRAGTTIEQVLAPNGTTGLKVNVQARASGTIKLDTVIQSPDGRLHLDDTSLELRSTAVSQLGLVLTICAGFFLLAWWIKHFRATRRARKLVDADGPDPARSEDERREVPARS